MLEDELGMVGVPLSCLTWSSKRSMTEWISKCLDSKSYGLPLALRLWPQRHSFLCTSARQTPKVHQNL